MRTEVCYLLRRKDRKGSKYFMFMLGLRETIYQLAMAISVHCYGHVLRREDCHV